MSEPHLPTAVEGIDRLSLSLPLLSRLLVCWGPFRLHNFLWETQIKVSWNRTQLVQSKLL